MLAVFRYLKNSGIGSTLSYEKILNRAGMGIFEPCVNLGEHNLISKISLYSLAGIPRSGIANNLRFHFLVALEKNLPEPLIDEISASTIKGQHGIIWAGQKLAEILNRDRYISQALLSFDQSNLTGQFQIEAISPLEINILGPEFSSPCRLVPLFLSNYPADIELDHVFNLEIAQKIAVHIRTLANLK